MDKVEKTTLLYLKSDQAQFDGFQNYEFRLTKPLQGVKSVRLVSFSMPVSWMNVNSFNNTLVWHESSNNPVSSAQHTTTLAVGNYNSAMLAAEIAAKMTAASTYYQNVYTCSFSSTTAQLTITGSSATTSFRLDVAGSTCASVIGLNADTASTGQTLTVTSGHLNLCPVSSVLINCPEVESASFNETFTHVLHVEPLGNLGYYDILRNSEPANDVKYINPYMATIRLSVTDQNGWSLLLEEDAEGHDLKPWVMTLLVSFW